MTGKRPFASLQVDEQHAAKRAHLLSPRANLMRHFTYSSPMDRKAVFTLRVVAARDISCGVLMQDVARVIPQHPLSSWIHEHQCDIVQFLPLTREGTAEIPALTPIGIRKLLTIPKFRKHCPALRKFLEADVLPALMEMQTGDAP